VTAPLHDQTGSWQPILDQLRKPGGLALSFLGLVLGLVTVFVLPQWQVPFQWLAAVIILWLAYLWISQAALREAGREIRMAREAEREAAADRSRSLEPKIIQAMINPSGENELILLLQPNRLFGQSMLVSIYYEDERGFELLVASGRVSNVQTNGLIQITVGTWEVSHDDVRRSIVAQQGDKLSRLLVRPAPTTSTSLLPDERTILNFLAQTHWQRPDSHE
jgi:hypothetical protein